MKDHLLVTVAAVAIATGAMVAFPPVSLAQAPATWPGIIISVSGSATISTKGMSPGSEIWAEWYSLPPGKDVVESARAVKWAYVEMTLDGEAFVTGAPTPMCDFLDAGGRHAAGSDPITDPGDVEVCNYAILPGSRTENRGIQAICFRRIIRRWPLERGDAG